MISQIDTYVRTYGRTDRVTARDAVASKNIKIKLDSINSFSIKYSYCCLPQHQAAFLGTSLSNILDRFSHCLSAAQCELLQWQCHTPHIVANLCTNNKNQKFLMKHLLSYDTLSKSLLLDLKIGLAGE